MAKAAPIVGARQPTGDHRRRRGRRRAGCCCWPWPRSRNTPSTRGRCSPAFASTAPVIGGKKDRAGPVGDRTPGRPVAVDARSAPTPAIRTFVVDPSLIALRRRRRRDHQRRARDRARLESLRHRHRHRPAAFPARCRTPRRALRRRPASRASSTDGRTRSAAGLVEGDLRFVGTTVVPVSPHPGRGLLRTAAERALQQTAAQRERTVTWRSRSETSCRRSTRPRCLRPRPEPGPS